MIGNKNKLISLLYFFIDIFAICFSAFISMVIRFKGTNEYVFFNWYVYAFLFILVVDLFFMYFHHLYDIENKSLLVQLPRVISSFSYTMFTFFVILFFLRNISFSRLTFSYFSVLCIISLIIGRYITVRILKHLYSKGFGRSSLLVIGINENSMHIVNYLNEHKEFGYQITGYLDEELESVSLSSLKYFGRIKEFSKVIIEYNISTVLLSTAQSCLYKDIIQFCEVNYIQLMMIPELLDIITSPVEINRIGAIPLIMFKESNLTYLQLRIKRLFDLIISLIAIIIISPILLIVASIVKINLGSPVIFKQTRLGMNGKLIKIYKFRTMVNNSEALLKKLFEEDKELEKEFKKEFKLKDDPRVTPIGKFLRSTSLDELPQFINVLKGDISLVGPRPIIPEEIDKYKEYGKLLLKLPPGLTGMWQISGRNDIGYDERINLDMYYINNWTFWLDLTILLKTLPAVLEKKGAY